MQATRTLNPMSTSSPRLYPSVPTSTSFHVAPLFPRTCIRGLRLGCSRFARSSCLRPPACSASSLYSGCGPWSWSAPESSDRASGRSLRGRVCCFNRLYELELMNGRRRQQGFHEASKSLTQKLTLLGWPLGIWLSFGFSCEAGVDIDD